MTPGEHDPRVKEKSARSPRTEKRAPTVVRDERDEPLSEVASTFRGSVGTWLKSPALDFYAIAIVGGLLILIGLLMVLSSSSVMYIAQGKSPYSGFLSQGIFAVVGLCGLLMMMFLPTNFLASLKFASIGLLVAFALQVAVFIPGVGVVRNGNRNWVKVGPVQGQPSEFLKLALAIWLGAFLAANRHRLRETPVLATAGVTSLGALGLVAAGRDLGTMLMIAALVAGAMWVAGVPKRWFIGAGALAVTVIVTLVLQSANRMARVQNWLHGECEGSSCFQSDNGMMALAEGGWWGVRLGQSRQKWGRIPHPDNDFIFAIVGEELGLVGTLSIVLLFTLLALALNRMVMRVREPFVQITAAAVATWLLVQAFVNMAVVTGLLPVLGVPLPFVSAGGSALVATMMALGLLLNFARSEPGAREAISAKTGFARRSAAVIADRNVPHSPSQKPKRSQIPHKSKRSQHRKRKA